MPLTQVEVWAARNTPITIPLIQMMHALIMSDGKLKVKPTAWRDGQNVIKDSRTKKIVYMPPEAKDVGPLMHEMITWINKSTDIPCPLVAAIAHYQYATIHPYYDGNGRNARLLATLLLHARGYGLKERIASLEEYYARNLSAYYEALTIGESHNYYMGREDADITKWIEYFIEGMRISFEHVMKYMLEEAHEGLLDHAVLIQKLDAKQRKVLELF